VKDLDPAIERVIMRCLEPDPAERPASALAVAAALPGGDPLAAALAAGETPSPEMVAASGETEGTRPRLAVAGLATVLACSFIVAMVGIRVGGFRLMPQPLPPEVLAAKAREVTHTLGYNEKPVDWSGEWYYQTEFTDYVRSHEGPRPNWARILSGRPQVLVYAYRQSPIYFDPTGFQGNAMTPGIVQFDDPPAIESGMINLVLDSQGRLSSFRAIPKEVEPNPPPAATVDWSPLFHAAEIDVTRLHSAEPEWVGLGAFDTRAAWIGTWPDSGRPLRVEAAAWHGKPVFFLLIGPWKQPTRMQHIDTNSGAHAGQVIELTILILLLASAAWIARRNYTQGKSHVPGAIRLLGTVFVIEMAVWLARAHFVPTLATFRHLLLALSTALFMSMALAMFYLALEPYVRRHWPQAIISWSRLTTGRVRDPLIGRDVLWGVTLGTVWSLVISIGLLLLERVGDTPQLPSQALLAGGRQLLGVWLGAVVQSIQGTLEFFFLLFLLRAVLRNKWLAAAVFVSILTSINSLVNPHPGILAPIWAVVYSIAAYAVVRFGLITLAVAIFTANTLLNLPYTLDFSNWYAIDTWVVVLSFVAMAAWGFHTSLAGQRLIKEELFQ
jgi:serine/threonine-protein kinase